MQKSTNMDDLSTFTPDDLEHSYKEENRGAREYADEQQVTEVFKGEKRLPVEFILDVSGSMQNDGKIDELNKTINECMECLLSCDDTAVSVDVGIITMGGIAPEVAMR